STGGAGGGPTWSCPDTDIPLTPGDIQFAALNPLPAGEQILFNDWNPSPNVLKSMTPDGATTTDVFAAYRVWSMGVSHAAGSIAFSCGDPQQEEHYGVNIGDAIQNTWVYDVAAQTAKLVAPGNVNDECHTFSADDGR